MLKTKRGKNSLLALLVLVPAGSIGTAMALYIAPGELGQTVFSFCKVWLLALPLAWFLWVDNGKLNLSLPKRQELISGTILGVLMFAIILGAYGLFGQHLINPTDVQTRAQEVGITSAKVYLLGAMYWILINSFLEEYIWRWFVGGKCQILIPGSGSIFLCALLFTLHHIIALAAYTQDWLVVIIGSLGVFLAGVIWSWCYLTYRSIWSCYVSHLLADLAIAVVGWQLLFG